MRFPTGLHGHAAGQLLKTAKIESPLKGFFQQADKLCEPNQGKADYLCNYSGTQDPGAARVWKRFHPKHFTMREYDCLKTQQILNILCR
jgi:hypothetical protein